MLRRLARKNTSPMSPRIGTRPIATSNAILPIMRTRAAFGRPMRFDDDIERQQRAGEIAAAWHDAEQRIKADADVRAWNLHGGVEQPRESRQPVAIAPRIGVMRKKVAEKTDQGRGDRDGEDGDASTVKRGA